jgi:hypothetical protein
MGCPVLWTPSLFQVQNSKNKVVDIAAQPAMLH